MNVKDEALRYWTLGCAVVPFKAKEKRPLVEWKQWEEQRQTKEEFDRLPWEKADGLALVCGTKLNNGLYLAVVDYDVKNLPEEIVEKGKQLVREFPITQMEETPSGGLHLMYFCREKPRTVSAYHNVCALEIIGEKKLVVVCPSVGYKRLNDNTPTEIGSINRMFEEVLTKNGIQIKTKENFWFGREDLGEEKYRGKDPPCIERLRRGTMEGLRNEYGIRLASYLANFRQINPKNVLKSLKIWNKLNKPPLEEKELENILKSALHGGYIFGCSDPILWKNCNREKCPIAPKDKTKLLTKEQKERAEKILENDILRYVLEYGKQRLIGEDNVLLINFVEICSGQTKYPISAIIEGYSGSGKNESLRAIKPLIPEEWLFEFTTSTPEAIKYIPDDFSGTLLIYEASGMQSKTSTLGLRAIGEGESIETIYPVRDEATGKMRLERYRTNARNFITTESDLDVQADLFRRTLKVSMNHALVLTKRVIAKKIRDAQLPDSLKALLSIQQQSFNVEDFQNALRLVDWKAEVVLFAPFHLLKLVDMAVTVEQKVAVRTHIDKILNFARVLALLYQRQRVNIQYGETHIVIAAPEDVFNAIQILGEAIFSTITRIGKRQREVLELFGEDVELDKHMVATKIGVSETTARKILKSLAQLGFLHEERPERKNQPYVYRLEKKPLPLGILESSSSYRLFWQKSVKTLLNRCCSAVPQGGIKILNEHLAEQPVMLEEKSIPLSGTTDTQPFAVVQNSFSEKNPFKDGLLEIPNEKTLKTEKSCPLEISKIKSLVRLTTHIEDKCVLCGKTGKMDFQVDLIDGSWGLLCDVCGTKLSQKLKDNIG
ncbi:hypothetical protein DRO45_00160 [Candidatus Bathyarchaeota archaeon]|nr:MAG: hypothetical protein DRO45_00160 [Candidatus Bathyarchaeota archaeon]